MRLVLVCLAPLIAAPALAQEVPAVPTSVATGARSDGSAALVLLQRDAVLNYWALKHYDADGDISLSPPEAEAAAQELKSIADSNADGRVTPYEFDRAREFIAARF